MSIDELPPNPEPASPEVAPPSGVVPPSGLDKSPLTAVVLSLFPGLGSIYNGLYLRGVTFFAVVLVLMRMADHGSDIWGFAVAFVWLFNMVDAYRQAKLIRLGFATDLGLADRPEPVHAGHGSLVAGVLIVLVGVASLLELQFGIDVDWLLDFWPVGLILLGAWFIWSAIRSRLQDAEAREHALASADEL